MTTLTELLIERKKENEIYFKNYLKYAREMKKETKKLLGRVRVFVFGSILRKSEIPQDIDILIVSEKLTTSYKKARMRAKIWKRIGPFTPFEFHFATPEEYQNWWQYFLKERVEI